jgi:hypothetical protein
MTTMCTSPRPGPHPRTTGGTRASGTTGRALTRAPTREFTGATLGGRRDGPRDTTHRSPSDASEIVPGTFSDYDAVVPLAVA